MEDNGKIISDYPGWWSGSDGKGLVVNSTSGHIKLKVKCINNGLFKIHLRTQDVRDDKRQRIPIFIKYTELKINNVDVLDSPVYAHHDNPFSYQKEVFDSEIIEISVKWDAI